MLFHLIPWKSHLVGSMTGSGTRVRKAGGGFELWISSESTLKYQRELKLEAVE